MLYRFSAGVSVGACGLCSVLCTAAVNNLYIYIMQYHVSLLIRHTGMKYHVSCTSEQMLLDAAVVVEDDGTIYGVYDMNDDGAEETVADMMAQGVEVADFRGKIMVPGFIDAHAHAPQVQVEGASPSVRLSVVASVLHRGYYGTL